MINFSTLQGLTIPEGVVTQIADASGRVLWSAVTELYTLYLRPSADISINHKLDSDTGIKDAYLLISEEVPDGISTSLRHEFLAGDTSTYSKSSSFKFSCENLPQKYRVKSAKLFVCHTGNDLIANSALLTNYRVEATISINESAEQICVVGTQRTTTDKNVFYRDYLDVTDFIKGKSLSSDFTVTLTQKCDDCTETTPEDSTKTTSNSWSCITTAWIEVEYS